MLDNDKGTYLRFTYYKELLSGIKIQELIEAENGIYRDKDPFEVIKYELENIASKAKNSDVESYQIYVVISGRISKLLEKGYSSIPEIKRLLTFLQLYFNLDVSFFNTLVNMNDADIKNIGGYYVY